MSGPSYFTIGNRIILAALLFIAGLIALGWFYLLPALTGYLADRFPESLEYKMGQQMKQSAINKSEVDSARTRVINDFFRQLDKEPRFPVHITVVNSRVKNAFALPGGEIVVYSALLEAMDSPDELVALLGHELGHVENRHSLKMLFKKLSNYIIISLILGDSEGISAIIAGNAAMLNELSHSRGAEEEADEYGFALMKKNRIALEGMPDLFRKLKDDNGSGQRIPDFLATHPSLDSRISRVSEWIEESPGSPAPPDSLMHYWTKLRR
jgi:beta-barrel assembly-enhancing protease